MYVFFAMFPHKPLKIPKCRYKASQYNIHYLTEGFVVLKHVSFIKQGQATCIMKETTLKTMF